MLCFECLEEIGKERVCPYCGTEMFPTVEEANKILQKNKNKVTRRKVSNKKNDEINQWFDMGLF